MKDETQLALDRFWQFGILPGDFLLAVLSNDLFGAIKRADLENRRDLVEICSYVYNEMPGGCWGDLHKIEAWSNKVNDELAGSRPAHVARMEASRKLEDGKREPSGHSTEIRELFDPYNLLFP